MNALLKLEALGRAVSPVVSKILGKGAPRRRRGAARFAFEALDPRLLLSSSISGTVYLDANANATADTGESGCGGVTVFADLDNDNAFDNSDVSTTTAGDGSYTLSGFAAG